MRRGEMIMAVALLITAGMLLRQALTLPIGWTGSGPGSGFFPFWLAVGVTISAAVVVVQSLRPVTAGQVDQPFIPPGAWKPLLVVFLPMVAVVAALRYLGIYLGAAIYLGGYMWFVGRHRWPLVVAVTLLVPLALFLIFEKWFFLLLPKGAILEYVLYGR